MKRLFRRWWKDESGGPAIEFAVVATFVAIALPALFDVASIIDTRMKLAAGMRAGTQFAVKYPSDEAGIAQAIASASGLPSDGVQVDVTQFCECSGLANSCDTTCSQNQSPAHYATIDATYALETNYTYYGFYDNPAPINKSLTVRTQ